MAIRVGIVGISGFGGGDSRFGYAESNENLGPYGLLRHTHRPEMEATIERLSGGSAAAGKQPGMATRLCPSIWAGQTSARPYAQPST